MLGDVLSRVVPVARGRLNGGVVHVLDVAEGALARHWLAAANGGLALVVLLAAAAPALVAAGLESPAGAIYWLYSAVCHQWPFRSFFLFGPQATYSFEQVARLAGSVGLWEFVGSPEMGYKMAFCERNLAIAVGALALGLFYVRVRHRLAPPSLLLYALLLAPLVVDGTTQLIGWRESTWELRVLTGLLGGAATTWLMYPSLDILTARTLGVLSLLSGPAATSRWEESQA